MAGMTRGSFVYASSVATAIVAVMGSSPALLGQGQGQKPPALPEGPGKVLVEARCVQCHAVNHGLGRVANAGYSREAWDRLLKTKLLLSASHHETLLDYLATSFPDKPKVPAVLVPGDTEISFQEWLLPTLGSRPHDVAYAPDGAIWWAGAWASRVGRLDVKTGAMKEYPVRVPSTPHGLVVDGNGTLWFTAEAGTYIGKLDPQTGAITEYPMPNPDARDPHTPVFDQKGTLWFTVQNGNGGMVGRLVPQTGEITLVSAPTPKSRPHGIRVNSKGIPWYVAAGSNRVASVDPVTMEVREYTLPNAKTTARRMAITADDGVWYADFSLGRIGRLDPATGAIREWPSPSGPQSQPYGMEALGETVWYSEGGVSPNTIVRFDPATERFQTWTIPSGGGVVRDIKATPDGNLIYAGSAVNHVGLIEIR
jgi:virginiamycin B lyase